MLTRADTIAERPEVPDEEELIEGAAKAIEAAIQGLHPRGIATVHLIDGRLVRVHPDGRHEDISPLMRPRSSGALTSIEQPWLSNTVQQR